VCSSDLSQKNISIEAIPPNQQFDFTHGTLFVDAAKISFPIILRSNQPGDRFTPYGKSGSKKVSRYFNEKKIAARERPHWPVLVSREKIVGIPGLTIDDSCKITSATQKIYKIEIHAQ
jgi:tRNA(Ile)-lysidine synthase